MVGKLYYKPHRRSEEEVYPFNVGVSYDDSKGFSFLATTSAIKEYGWWGRKFQFWLKPEFLIPEVLMEVE